jgi:FMN phosphatase YigB (HAD superfamily)
MAEGRRYRALSLDLWFTVVSHGPEEPAGWEAERIRIVREHLERGGGPKLRSEEIGEALRAISADSARTRTGVTTDPGALVRRVADRLGAQVLSPETAGRALSDAGVEEHPPTVNPEVGPVLRFLEQNRIPTVLVTNSARRATTWDGFFRRRGLRFTHVVSSADLGVAKPDPGIFQEASRRLGVPLDRLLHVGDRWELDVVGAAAAGCGAGLYRGLWHRYGPAGYELPEPPAEMPGVLLLDRLDALAALALWETDDRLRG